MTVVAMTACSSDEDGKEQETIFHMGITMPYLPTDIQEMPNWLAKQVETFGLSGMTVCKGTWKGEPIYNVLIGYMSNFVGLFYDKDGELMPTGVDYTQEVKDWKCIYHHRIGGKL